VWGISRKSKFKTQYKKLPQQIQNKVDEALIALAKSEKPRLLGTYKQSLGVWAYELNDSYRMLYNVNDSENLIELFRVGDHKEVYGKD
jgi:addiction module RelE/StbE family toxin